MSPGPPAPSRGADGSVLTGPTVSAREATASFPLGRSAPYNKSRTVTRSPARSPADVPPVAAASSDTSTTVSKKPAGSTPVAKCRNTVLTARIFVRLATLRGACAHRDAKTFPERQSMMQSAAAVVGGSGLGSRRRLFPAPRGRRARFFEGGVRRLLCRPRLCRACPVISAAAARSSLFTGVVWSLPGIAGDDRLFFFLRGG